jgi:hypothetical protein
MVESPCLMAETIYEGSFILVNFCNSDQNFFGSVLKNDSISAHFSVMLEDSVKAHENL